MGERMQGTLSGGLVVEDSRKRLMVVHNKLVKKWGVPAGGLEEENGSLTELLLQEFSQETMLNSDFLSVSPFDRENPLEVVLVGEKWFKVGNVFRVKFTGWNLPKEWEVEGDKSVDRVKLVGPNWIRNIIKRGEVYRPEFNVPVFEWWLDGCRWIRKVLLEIPQIDYSDVEKMKRKGSRMWAVKK